MFSPSQGVQETVWSTDTMGGAVHARPATTLPEDWRGLIAEARRTGESDGGDHFKDLMQFLMAVKQNSLSFESFVEGMRLESFPEVEEGAEALGSPCKAESKQSATSTRVRIKECCRCMVSL